MRKILLAALFAITAGAAQAQQATWVQLGPGGTAEVRAVVDGEKCPTLYADGVAMEMKSRAAKDNAFVLTCAAPIPSGTKSLSMSYTTECPPRQIPEICDVFVLGRPIVIPVPAPQRIVVFGDTGCRIKGKEVQDCSDPDKWPFPRIAAQAAKLKPDLVIHVGDYLYRENACPADFKGCAGTPFGDNWPTWNADFFAPAAPLLAAAPWVFVRGNHEDCERAGPGWLRLLGPLGFDASAPCAAHLAPYSVALGSVNLTVMDDASAPDTSAAADLVPVFRREIAALASASAPSWLTLHRPIWAAITGPLGIPAGGNRTIIDAVGSSGIPSPTELMLSGHIHTFEAINYFERDHVPPQIVAGFGGDNLDVTPANLKGSIFQGDSGVHVKDGLSLPGFGFLLMTKNARGWAVDVYDMHGAIERRCVFQAGRVDCPK